jgi:choline dehydrogenase-like flavoprotein
MEHLEMKAGELWFERPDRLKMYMWGYNYTKARAELAVSPELQRQYKTLNGTSSLSPLEDAREMKPFMDQWEDEKGEGMAKRMRTDPEEKAAASPEPEFKSTNAFQLFMRIEQAPNPDSRITLDDERDELGVPRSRLHWTFTELEKRSIRKIHEIIGTEAGLSGAARVRLLDYLRDEKDTGWPEFTGGGWHHMGTTRMGDDPKTSVVDADCKVHGIDNLFVTGSSCFTTAGAPNPTLTLVALSLRLADHLKAKSR